MPATSLGYLGKPRLAGSWRFAATMAARNRLYCLALLAATISDMAGQPNCQNQLWFWAHLILAFVPFGMFMLASVAVAQGGPNLPSISRRVAITSTSLAAVCTCVVVWSRYHLGLFK
jgi:hypothetical protein